MFEGGRSFDFNYGDNLFVDLGETDFSKNPDPLKISIDDISVFPWGVDKAVHGHVYRSSIHDRGNHFYVYFRSSH